MIKAFFFDMDGLLIDSEPCWVAAEQEIFATVGIRLDAALCAQTTGLRHDAVVRYWYERFPWNNKSCTQVANELVERVLLLIAEAKPLPGVHEIIAAAQARKLTLALCSSSPYRIIDQVVTQLKLEQTFTLVYSAEDERYGKPHPGAYLTTASRCDIAVEHCLVFEDSLNGAIAGKAAGMRVVAVPQGAAYESTRFDFCDAKLRSLSDFDASWFARFEALT